MMDSNLSAGEWLNFIRGDVRLLEMALIGAKDPGVTLADETYRAAVTQQVRDIALNLDALAQVLKPDTPK